MRYGIREICDVVFRAKSYMELGSRKFYKDEPVLYFDSLKTSTLEGASGQVYAQGGRGNPRLIVWDGDKTLTFNMEDALISEMGLAILAGADLLAASETAPIYVHQTSQVEVKTENTIELPAMACWGRLDKENEYYHANADICIMTLDDNGYIDGEPCIPKTVVHQGEKTIITCGSHDGTLEVGKIALVDYYVKKIGHAQQINIGAEKFAGNFYIEGSTLWRRESDGVDEAAEIIIPNGKIQTNFTFSMAASGDPSTFSFVVDALPDYTKFDRTKKVLAAIQVISSEALDDGGKRPECTLGAATEEPVSPANY